MPFLFQPQLTAIDSNGDPISGAKLNTYEAGTSTPLATYSDSGLSVAHANPVVADSAGRFAIIYTLNQDYKLVLTDASDNTITTMDPVAGSALSSVTDGISDTATSTKLQITDTATHIEDPLTVGDLITAADGLVHFLGGTAGAVTAPADASELTIEDDNTAGLSILTPDAFAGLINFGAPSSATYVQIQGDYNTGSPFLAISVGGVETLRMTATPTQIIRGWVKFAGATGTIADSHNVTSVTRNGVGDYTVTWDTDFANANYAVIATAENTPGNASCTTGIGLGGQAVGTVDIETVRVDTDVLADASNIHVMAIGDQ